MEAVSLSRWFPAREESVPQARDWAVEVASSTGHAPLGPTVELLVSELATNAIQHAGGDRFLVEFDIDKKIIVAVCDPSSEVPTPRSASKADTDGRGLEIIEKMADQWGVAVSSRGKCVWFQLDEHAEWPTDGGGVATEEPDGTPIENPSG